MTIFKANVLLFNFSKVKNPHFIIKGIKKSSKMKFTKIDQKNSSKDQNQKNREIGAFFEKTYREKIKKAG